MKTTMLILVLFIFTACEKKVNPFPDHMGSKIFQGQQNAKVNCANCHGDLGGGGMKAPNVAKAVKNLTAEQFSGIVMNGKGSMPPFADTLKEEEILEILDWLNKLPS